jgi:hypothetical protein
MHGNARARVPVTGRDRCTAKGIEGGSVLCEVPITCQFDRLSDQSCQSLDRLSGHFAKHCSWAGNFEPRRPDKRAVANILGFKKHTML